ncbi:hypothetical protein [Streptomyces sp. NPDC005017]|uniref:hypothetical protein n=1 Tax=Streptomyces sp. NPDC005017 TaxID=3364706 RepID=UPI0036C95325
MTEHKLKKVLVYFHLVSDARRFARELPYTLRLLRKSDLGLAPGILPPQRTSHPSRRAGGAATAAESLSGGR